MATSVGTFLRHFRMRAGLRQADLAERAGVSVATIGAIEDGRRRRPHPNTMAALADALGLTAEQRAILLEQASGGMAQPEAHVPQDAAAFATVEGSRPPVSVTRTAPPVKLPQQATLLVGRESELEACRTLLQSTGGQVRLLTLIGPGGVGKTRLAVAIAADVVGQYAHGSSFVDLARLVDPRLVPATIADALRIVESAGRSARELVLMYLEARQFLLILDNFEHLLSAAPFVNELLLSCTRLAILVTSRTALRLRFERCFPVGPLSVPTAHMAPGAVADSGSVRLFVDRGRAVDPGLRLNATGLRSVAEICRRLDGMPLAIELAAARFRLLGPQNLLRRLERTLPLLTDGASDLPERQRSVRQTLAWSHSLLAPAQHALFRRLAVFVGGWTLQSAEAVCAGGELAREAVLDQLDSLVNNSLVQAAPDANGEPRFTLLGNVREYAHELLGQSGEQPTVVGRHLDWFAAIARPRSVTPVDPTRVAALAPEHDNLRAALRAALDRGARPQAEWLGAALWHPWYVRGSYAEGRALLREVLALPTVESHAAARAQALLAAAHLALSQGDYAAAEAGLDETLVTADRLGDAVLRGACVHVLASVARWRGDLDRARSLYTGARDLFHQVGHSMWEATTLMTLAAVVDEQGEAEFASACAEESLELFEANDNPWGQARALFVLARIAAQRGDRLRARSLHEASLALERQVATGPNLARSFLALAEVVRDGNVEEARQLYTESLALAEKSGDQLTITRSLEGLAGSIARESPERAVRMAAAAAMLRASLGASPQPTERHYREAWLSMAQESLGETAFAAAWASGRAHGLPRAIVDALDLIDPMQPVAARSC